MNVVLRVISMLNNTNPVVDIHNAILDLCPSAQHFVTQMCPKGLFVIFLCSSTRLRRDSDWGLVKYLQKGTKLFLLFRNNDKKEVFENKKNTDLLKDSVLKMQVM
jgi:hypothetical protein